MKQEILQLMPQKHQRSYETTMNKYMLTNWKTEETNKSLEIDNLPSLTHEEIGNLKDQL